jgi:hypothetical protein
VPIILNPESELAKELAKWDQTPADRDPIKNQFPKMLYKVQLKQGKPCVSDPEDAAFSQRCQHVVKSEAEQRIAEGQGWIDGPQKALDAYEAQQIAVADEAANVAYHAAHMSDKAQREYKQASDETHEHVVDLQPVKKKSHHKPKAVTVSTE